MVGSGRDQMRPVFFRPTCSNRAFSGWQSGNWREVFAARETVERLAVAVPDEIVDRDKLLALEPVIPREILRVSDVVAVRPAFQFGDRVIFANDVDLWPHTFIHSGGRGVVARCDIVTGEVWVYLERFHTGLEDWGNTMWLIPHLTDDTLPSVVIENSVAAARAA